MAGCHHVMLLLDAAGGAEGSSRLRRTALRLLGYLSCRFGLARLRWAFKCFDSMGARGREARGSDFRELRAGAWQDLEAELEARAGIGVSPAADPRPEARAAPTQRALLEALLDYHWDQPEIASPAKTPLLDDDTAAQRGPRHAVFLLAPCPRSSRDLLQFAGVPDAPASRHAWHQLLLPKRLQDGLRARGITLCWVDTGEPSPVSVQVGRWRSGGTRPRMILSLSRSPSAPSLFGGFCSRSPPPRPRSPLASALRSYS